MQMWAYLGCFEMKFFDSCHGVVKLDKCMINAVAVQYELCVIWRQMWRNVSSGGRQWRDNRAASCSSRRDARIDASDGCRGRCRRRPVRRRRRRKKTGTGSHQVELGRYAVMLVVVMMVMMMIGGWHKQSFRRVLVAACSDGGRRRISRLHRLRQSGKVELVRVPLAVHFGHDVLVVVVTQSAAQFVIVHVWFTLAFTPASSNLVWVSHLELTRRAFPRYARRVAGIRQ